MRYPSSLIAILLLSSSIWPPAIADSHKKHRLEIDAWIKEMMSGSKGTSGALVLQRFKDSMYIVVKPYSWEPDDAQLGYKKVNVPKGFVTDLTSVPSLFWSKLRPDGDYVYAAIAHDYLYWTQERDRGEADEVLNLIMKDFGIDKLTRFAIYQAVDKFGWISWGSNRELRKNGQKRYLKLFPQDPKMTWEMWKRRSGVFHDRPLTETAD